MSANSQNASVVVARRAGLRELPLRPEYRSDGDDLLRDFYLPCLGNSSLYRRAVGYFTSRGLAAAAQGVTSLIDRGGRMLLVASPLFELDDLEAIGRGYEARDQVVARALVRNLDTADEAVIKDRLGYLAWLVAHDRLEIRVAVPVSDNGCLKPGIYHEKLGLFMDESRTVVAFTGSPNETAGGLVNNFESIDVFWSWDDPQERVTHKIANFERLWGNRTAGLEVIAFPEAARRHLLKFRPEAPPASEIQARDVQVREKPLPDDLWTHQVEAIQAWENVRRSGLVSMATGTGKTRMALVAAERCTGLQLLVVAVPRAALVHQWASELQRQTAFPCPVLVHEAASNWQDSLFNRLRATSGTSQKGPIVVVGTMHSLSGERFTAVMTDAPHFENGLLVVDEVHNVGAPTFRRLLRPSFRWRLGLSATPARHFDEEGTSVIREYFGETVYVYDLRRALADGHLCPYRYFVYPAELSPREYEEYEELTRHIARLRYNGERDVTYQCDNVLDGDSTEVRTLLFRRARILKRCAAKLVSLRTVLADHPARRCLIYCADNEQLGLVRVHLEEQHSLHLIYTADTPSNERQQTLAALGRGDMPIVLAIDCLDEGVDVPTVDQAIIVASSSNKRQFIQRRGRILRRAPGKSTATLVDIVALPPSSAGISARKMLNGELARAKEMAQLSLNKYEALQRIQSITSQYGVTLAGLLSGEGDG